MKRILGFILALLMVCTAGCGQDQPKTEGEQINLYFLSKSGMKVEAHPYVLTSSSLEEQVAEVMDRLSTLPDKLEYQPPLAQEFKVNSYQIEDGCVKMDLTANYKEMMATKEILIRAALVRSLTQIKGINFLSFTVEGEPLKDNLGNLVGMMSAGQFIDNAGDTINTYEKVRLKLYFGNEAGDRLIATTRTLDYNTIIPMEKLVLEELIKGPDSSFAEAHALINPATKIVSVSVKDGICYVNLDSTFTTQIYNGTAEVVLYSIVNSLTELGNVKKVQFSIDGVSEITYREKYSFTTIFERNLDLIETK
ncbi:MAG: GerMN domain-containing protein [Lachnospiraceae bacterium]|nr:GerMN domain-containing protein [Lachnospiraceae bacterium]